LLSGHTKIYLLTQTLSLGSGWKKNVGEDYARILQCLPLNTASKKAGGGGEKGGFLRGGGRGGGEQQISFSLSLLESGFSCSFKSFLGGGFVLEGGFLALLKKNDFFLILGDTVKSKEL